jgi:predicted XRE-type DNA-binding protein
MKDTMPYKTITVADYLSRAISLANLKQREVAEAVGYRKPNVISMMRLGQTKVPIEKIPLFAKALGVDPAQITRLALIEYMPEVWAAIEQTLGEVVTEREKKFLKILREIDPAGEIEIDDRMASRIREVFRGEGCD